MGNVSNLRIGPCRITWKGQDVGFTLGGATLTYERKLTDLTVDKYGDSPVDMALTSTTLKIVTKVAEPVANKIKQMMPEGTDVVSGGNEQVGFAAGEGATMRQYAGLLTLHPLSKSDTDYSEDVTIYLAVPSNNVELGYEVANQRAFTVEFSALVDEEYTAGRRLGHIGPVNVS